MNPIQPELNQKLNIRLDEEFLTYLHQVAVKNHLKLSTFCRQVLMQNTYKYQPDDVEATAR